MNSYFANYFKNTGLTSPIESYLVFINPEFTLYHAPENPQIILPTQVNRFMKKLNMIPTKLTDRHFKLAELLISLHQPKNPFVKLPVYDYEHLSKVNTCSSCNSLSLTLNGKTLTCVHCGFEEHLESVILRSVEELKLLFPNKNITTNLVYDWCAGIVSEKVIRRILLKRYKIKGHGKYSYYIS